MVTQAVACRKRQQRDFGPRQRADDVRYDWIHERVPRPLKFFVRTVLDLMTIFVPDRIILPFIVDAGCAKLLQSVRYLSGKRRKPLVRIGVNGEPVGAGISVAHWC